MSHPKSAQKLMASPQPGSVFLSLWLHSQIAGKASQALDADGQGDFCQTHLGREEGLGSSSNPDLKMDVQKKLNSMSKTTRNQKMSEVKADRFRLKHIFRVSISMLPSLAPPALEVRPDRVALYKRHHQAWRG